jgi:hypothetical protein
MRLGVVAAAALLGLLTVTTAQAQLTFELYDPILVGSEWQVGGTIINNTGDTFELDGTTLNITNAASSLDIFGGEAGLEFTDLPLTFAPGDFYNSDALFVFTVPSPFTQDIFGEYILRSGANEIGRDTFFLAAPSEVPEPGTMALLVGSLVGGGLMLARRRK